MKIEKAAMEDLSDILVLQKTAYKSEAEIYNDFSIPPLQQTIEEMQDEWKTHNFLKIVDENGNIVGSVRAVAKERVCFIGKLIVHPEFQNKGIGKSLMSAIENQFNNLDSYELFTGSKSRKNISLYKKLGYSIFKNEKIKQNLELIYFRKENQNPAGQ